MADGAAPVGPRGPKWWERIPQPWRWALLGVAAVVILVFVLHVGPWLFTRAPNYGLNAEQELKARNDVRTTLVQAVAGIAVATGAIVTYRTFRHNQLDEASRRAEQNRAYVTDTYTKAVEQLGHKQAPVRLGALHSLVSLAQGNPSRRQTVVDVICAYLRMPDKTPRVDTPVTNAANAEGGRDRAQEFEVRQSAQRLLADHLRRPPGTSGETARGIEASSEEDFWPGISLDLTGATLVHLDLRESTVVRAIFNGAIFSGDTLFTGAAFSEVAAFDGAIFADRKAVFNGTAFFGIAAFRKSTFSHDAEFVGAAFHRDATFAEATFRQDASFRRATFSRDADFVEATFSKNAEFTIATFSGTAWFGSSHFSGGAWFIGARFFKAAVFDGATFDSAAAFRAVSFRRAAVFDGATFSGATAFDGAMFCDAAAFDRVKVLNTQASDLNEAASQVWPDGWTVHPDANDPTRGTLIAVVDGMAKPPMPLEDQR